MPTNFYYNRTTGKHSKRIWRILCDSEFFWTFEIFSSFVSLSWIKQSPYANTSFLRFPSIIGWHKKSDFVIFSKLNKKVLISIYGQIWRILCDLEFFWAFEIFSSFVSLSWTKQSPHAITSFLRFLSIIGWHKKSDFCDILEN